MIDQIPGETEIFETRPKVLSFVLVPRNAERCDVEFCKVKTVWISQPQELIGKIWTVETGELE
jgi:hypothetical protein